MKNMTLSLIFLIFSIPCIAQKTDTDTIPVSDNPQLQVPANRARIDNKTGGNFVIYLRIEGGTWIMIQLTRIRTYIYLDDCGIIERYCKKEVGVCTLGQNDCNIIELKSGTAYQIVWDYKNSCWTIVEIRKD